MTCAEEVMEICEAFHRTQSVRGVAELADYSRDTVADYVAAGDAAGGSAGPVRPGSCWTPTGRRSGGGWGGPAARGELTRSMTSWCPGLAGI